MNKAFTLLLVSLCFNLFGQTVEHYETLAMESFHAKDFPTALLYSEKIIQQDDHHVSSLYYAGESARRLNDLPKAEQYLEKIPDDAKAGYFAVTDYNLGLVKQGLEKRDEAKNYYANYLAKHYDENSLYTHLASAAIHSLAEGNDWVKDGSPIDALPDNINTDLADLAPVRYADKLFFSSVLEENYLPTKKKGKKKKMERRPVSRIYEAQFNQKARESKVNPRSAILNASNVTLMPDASRMYYTLCSDKNPNEQNHCTIWYRNRFYDGTWGPGVKLPEVINNRRATNTQPSVGYDWTLKKYVLYFVSDREGGAGGKDIWCAVIDQKNDEYGEPFPLPINSPEDDITPFFHQSSQTLFFSSKGWSGKGGYDVFHTAKRTSEDWKAPVNMGSIMNTNKDEFYYTYHTSSKFAYFVSGEEKEGALVADIFEARVFIDYNIRAFDKFGKSPLTDFVVEITDTATGATGRYESNEISNKSQLKLEPGARYLVKVMAEDYVTNEFEINTEKISYFDVQESNIFLQPYARP